ncbi:Tfp pilus assembly protein FimT [Dyella marensis]|uniref:Tfp pilus assembly protein FimT n=2 Tax=Rhodanobacteraceae TaxID=1775411 RepID=A0A1I1ZQQ4_9GAMM|nr:Tfp pilus assembly protein FimT [Dyella marensis]
MSLIELMVTITLMFVICLVGLPLTKAWVDSAHQREAAGILAEGLGRAKALAMRNPSGIADPAQPGAFVCLSGNTIAVARPDQSTACGKGTLAWSATLPTGSSIVLASKAAFHCVAYSARGAALAMDVAAATCTTTSIEAHAGDEDAFVVSVP